MLSYQGCASEMVCDIDVFFCDDVCKFILASCNNLDKQITLVPTLPFQPIQSPRGFVLAEYLVHR